MLLETVSKIPFNLFANSASYPKFAKITSFYRFLLDSTGFHKNVLTVLSSLPTL